MSSLQGTFSQVLLNKDNVDNTNNFHNKKVFFSSTFNLFEDSHNKDDVHSTLNLHKQDVIILPNTIDLDNIDEGTKYEEVSKLLDTYSESIKKVMKNVYNIILPKEW